MKTAEQKLEQKNQRHAAFLAALDTWDGSIEEHESRTEFCTVDCPGCKQREIALVLEQQWEEED